MKENMRDFTNQSNIESIEFLEEEIEMMDLEVDEVHCFYANGVLVHNCSEEIALMANFSQEPNLVQPLLEGRDIHNYIAKQMFGFEDPSHRTKVKVLNFAVNYGGGARTIANKLGCTIEEGQKLLDHYNNTLSRLTRWKQEICKEGRRKGMVFTYFGRPRIVWPYYNSSDKSMWAFADRTCVNSPIQGCLPSFTRVLTAYGYAPIVSIKPGDLVWNGMYWTPAYLVPKGPAHLVKVVTADNDVLWCDDRHKVKCKVDDEYVWVDIHDLEGKYACMNREENPRLDVSALCTACEPYESYRLSKVTSVSILDDVQDMYTLATLHPLHQFVTDGFISKNTGGDLIRIDHVKLMNKLREDPEFAENVLYSNTVHDEINLFVKPSYLQKAYKALLDIMVFHPSNFIVPILPSPAVGPDWGHLIDAKSVTANNHIVIERSKCVPLPEQSEEEMLKNIDEWESQPNY